MLVPPEQRVERTSVPPVQLLPRQLGVPLALACADRVQHGDRDALAQQRRRVVRLPGGSLAHLVDDRGRKLIGGARLEALDDDVLRQAARHDDVPFPVRLLGCHPEQAPQRSQRGGQRGYHAVHGRRQVHDIDDVCRRRVTVGRRKHLLLKDAVALGRRERHQRAPDLVRLQPGEHLPRGTHGAIPRRLRAPVAQQRHVERRIAGAVLLPLPVPICLARHPHAILVALVVVPIVWIRHHRRVNPLFHQRIRQPRPRVLPDRKAGQPARRQRLVNLLIVQLPHRRLCVLDHPPEPRMCVNHILPQHVGQPLDQHLGRPIHRQAPRQQRRPQVRQIHLTHRRHRILRLPQIRSHRPIRRPRRHVNRRLVQLLPRRVGRLIRQHLPLPLRIVLDQSRQQLGFIALCRQVPLLADLNQPLGVELVVRRRGRHHVLRDRPVHHEHRERQPDCILFIVGHDNLPLLVKLGQIVVRHGRRQLDPTPVRPTVPHRLPQHLPHLPDQLGPQIVLHILPTETVQLAHRLEIVVPGD